MQCVKCEANIKDGVNFCPKCGAPAQAAPSNETKACPQCGEPNTLNAKFCKKDGYRFESTTKTPDAAKQSNAKQAVMPSRVICPQCGTENSANAKFCKKDGVALKGQAAPAPAPAPKSGSEPRVKMESVKQTDATLDSEKVISSVTTATMAKKSNNVIIIGLLAGLIILMAAGGYAYWEGYFGNRQGSVQEKINAEFLAKGFENVKIVVDQDWSASISGNVTKQAQIDQLQTLTKAHTALKNISLDMIQVLPNVADLKQKILDALSQNGLIDQAVVVNDDFTAIISGDINSDDQRKKVISIAESVAGVKSATYESTAVSETPDVAPIAKPKQTIINKKKPIQKPRKQPATAIKKPAVTNQPAAKEPEVETKAEQPDITSQENNVETEAKKTPSNISESLEELREKLDNIKKLKTRPMTKEEQDKKFCPIPGQSC